jgi:hypothetical protein
MPYGQKFILEPDYSIKTMGIVDKEVSKFLNGAYKQTKNCLRIANSSFKYHY